MLSSTKGYQFQSINDILSLKINEKKDSTNNSLNNINNKINSPILNLNSPNNSTSPKIMKMVKGGANSNSTLNSIQLNNHTTFKPDTNKSLTPTNNNVDNKFNYNAYNSNNSNTNSGFYNKMLQNNNTNEIKKIAENKILNFEKLKKDKFDFEMKILEEDFNEENPKESSYYNNYKKEEEKEKEKQILQQQQKKKPSGLLNLFSKILPK